MKKLKVKKLMVITLACLSVVAGSTYAWYVARNVTNQVTTTTGWVRIGTGEMVNTENLLPGESAYLNPEDGNPGYIANQSSTPIIAEMTFEGKTDEGEDLVSGTLPIGANPPAQYIGVDYVFDAKENVYRYTQKRLKEVVYPEMVLPAGSRFTKVNENYYISIEKKVTDWPEMEKIYLRLLPELGGNRMNPATGVKSPDRPYESASRFIVYYKVTGVQKTEAAIVNMFGDDIANLYF